MNKILTLFAIIVLSSCAPALQTDLLVKEQHKLQEINQSCAAENKSGLRITEVNCRFAGYEQALGQDGFEEFNAFDKLRAQYTNIARQLDAKKITESKAENLFEQASLKFYQDVHVRDGAKIYYSQMIEKQNMAALGTITVGLARGLQAYSNARYPANTNTYSPSSCSACQQGIQQSQNFIQDEQYKSQQQSEQQQMQELQEQIQKQQQQINNYNSWSPAHRIWGSSYLGP